MNTKLQLPVADRDQHFPKRMNQEGRKSGTCSHAAVQRLRPDIIVYRAAALFTIRRWLLSVEC